MTNYHPEIMATQDHKQVTITAYINSRGVLSAIKTIGFKPVELQVHESYYNLGAAGKALFRQNAYNALMND